MLFIEVERFKWGISVYSILYEKGTFIPCLRELKKVIVVV